MNFEQFCESAQDPNKELEKRRKELEKQRKEQEKKMQTRAKRIENVRATIGKGQAPLITPGYGGTGMGTLKVYEDFMTEAPSDYIRKMSDSDYEQFTKGRTAAEKKQYDSYRKPNTSTTQSKSQPSNGSIVKAERPGGIKKYGSLAKRDTSKGGPLGKPLNTPTSSSANSKGGALAKRTDNSKSGALTAKDKPVQKVNTRTIGTPGGELAKSPGGKLAQKSTPLKTPKKDHRKRTERKFPKLGIPKVDTDASQGVSSGDKLSGHAGSNTGLLGGKRKQ